MGPRWNAIGSMLMTIYARVGAKLAGRKLMLNATFVWVNVWPDSRWRDDGY
jgi:hypothetical protein